MGVRTLKETSNLFDLHKKFIENTCRPRTPPPPHANIPWDPAPRGKFMDPRMKG